MIILDTDHIAVLKYPESVSYRSLVARMELAQNEVLVIAIVKVEDQMPGWFSEIGHACEDLHSPKSSPLCLTPYLVSWRM